jgi:hypothetical protein
VEEREGYSMGVRQDRNRFDRTPVCHWDDAGKWVGKEGWT